MIQAAAPRKRDGHGDRPAMTLVAMWTGASTTNSTTSPAMRRTARALRRGLAVAIEGDAVKLHAMVDEAVAEPFGNPLLQCFKLVVDELDHIAGLDIDQMVVVG